MQIFFRWLKNENNIKRSGLWHFHAVNVAEDHLTVAKWMQKHKQGFTFNPHKKEEASPCWTII